MKKLLAVVVILTVLLTACAAPPSLTFPMPGSNIAQLQPAQIVREVADFLGVEPDELFMPTDFFPLMLTTDFHWAHLHTICLIFTQETRHGMQQYTSQLQGHPDSASFRVLPAWQLRYPRQPLNRLQDFLNALHYLPQQHILDLVYPPAAAFMLELVLADTQTTYHPNVFYNRHGVVEQPHGEFVLLALLPMYAAVEVDGYIYMDHTQSAAGYAYGGTTQSFEQGFQGTGADTIFLFFELG